MNLSPDPQLATSSPMDYEEKYNALLLKETKTNNDNVYLKSRFEELKESHQDLISQLEKHKIIKAHEWFETGDISDSLTLIAGVGLNKINATIPKEVIEENEMLKSHHTWWLKEGGMEKYEELKVENATLKEIQKMNQNIREEYEKEMRDIKIAMGCEGPLSWDITDILRWIEMSEDQLEGARNAADEANADYERLVDKNNNDNLNFGDILSERDAEIAKLKEEATTWENIARGKSSALKKHLPDYNPKFWTGSDESNIDYCFDKINDEIAKLKSDSNNLMCVINHLKIDYKKVLKEIEADCSPDAWDSM